jgi:hypothetical protein
MSKGSNIWSEPQPSGHQPSYPVARRPLSAPERLRAGRRELRRVPGGRPSRHEARSGVAQAEGASGFISHGRLRVGGQTKANASVRNHVEIPKK